MSWKKIIKKSELIPFPPGSGEEESWMFPYDINETFVQSPRNRRRVSYNNHTHSDKIEGDQAWYHLIMDHSVGISRLDKIDFDRIDSAELIHKLLHEPKITPQ